MKEKKTASIRLKFRPSSAESGEGTLYYQIIYNRTIRRIATGHTIYKEEWNSRSERIILPDCSSPRHGYLNALQDDTAWEMRQFEEQSRTLEADGKYTFKRLVATFRDDTSGGNSMFGYLRRRSEQLAKTGRIRSSETMQSTLKSFMCFRGGIDLSFNRFDRNVVEQYETYMKGRRLSRNTSSFYMRNLRAAYNKAMYEVRDSPSGLFRKVYTGVDKTAKRAISIEDLRKIKRLNIADRPALSFARDILFFSFYARGMSFVDIVMLRKKDLSEHYITYRRKKTGQRLSIEAVPEIKAIINKYKSPTQYLLPLITREDGTELTQYKNQLVRINRNLKTIGKMAGLHIPLTTYVMRHTWASIAHRKGIALAVISEGLGHDNEMTTQIYLASIQASEVDKANRSILDEL